ncbi:hypothetical protein JL09_g5212 [Pichia kudriavzevii]|uniref:Uncharacterized protein n=2 Tax=Pichia kudriavzevii TaxID=4909 RepID=A0A099NS49_PICKU|nr:hypothetical protein JL09_g5212 [Pichia kudriavzevii]
MIYYRSSNIQFLNFYEGVAGGISAFDYLSASSNSISMVIDDIQPAGYLR